MSYNRVRVCQTRTQHIHNTYTVKKCTFLKKYANIGILVPKMCISRVRVVYVLDKHVHGLNVLICSVLKSNFATVYVFDEKNSKKNPTGVFWELVKFGEWGYP